MITSHCGRQIDTDKPVEVYRNLHKKLWSIRQDGKVCGHARQVYLKDAEFIVSESGRQRVIEEKRKNVHAYVKGYLTDVWAVRELEQRTCTPDECLPYQVATYNPYLYAKFVDKSSKQPIISAEFVDMDIDAPFGDHVLVMGEVQ